MMITRRVPSAERAATGIWLGLAALCGRAGFDLSSQLVLDAGTSSSALADGVSAGESSNAAADTLRRVGCGGSSRTAVGGIEATINGCDLGADVGTATMGLGVRATTVTLSAE